MPSSTHEALLPSPIREGWREVQADDGRIYFCNDETGESAWEKPRPFVPDRKGGLHKHFPATVMQLKGCLDELKIAQQLREAKATISAMGLEITNLKGEPCSPPQAKPVPTTLPADEPTERADVVLLKDEISELKAQLEKCQSESEQLQVLLARCDTACNSAASKILKLQAKCERQHFALQEASRRVRHLSEAEGGERQSTEESEKLLSRNEMLERELEKLQARYEEGEREAQILEARNKVVEKEMERVRALHIESEGDVKRLEVAHEEAMKSLGSATAESERVKARNEELEKENMRNEARNEELEKQIKRYEARNEELEEIVERSEARNAELEGQRTRLEAEMAGERKKALARRAQVEAEMQRLGERELELEGEMERARTREAEVEREMQRLESKRAEADVGKGEHGGVGVSGGKLEEMKEKLAAAEAGEVAMRERAEGLEGRLEVAEAEGLRARTALGAKERELRCMMRQLHGGSGEVESVTKEGDKRRDEGGGVGSLPRGWRQVQTEDGKAYFCNDATGESSWSKPHSEEKQNPPSPPPTVKTPSFPFDGGGFASASLPPSPLKRGVREVSDENLLPSSASKRTKPDQNFPHGEGDAKKEERVAAPLSLVRRSNSFGRALQKVSRSASFTRRNRS